LAHTSIGPGPAELIGRAELLKEMKEIPLFPSLETEQSVQKLLKKEKPTKVPQQSDYKYTQTEAFMRVWFNIPEDKQLTEDEEQSYIRTLLQKYQLNKNKQNVYVPLIKEILENEKRFSADFVLYHAYTGKFGLLFDIQREIYDFLNIQGTPE